MPKLTNGLKVIDNLPNQTEHLSSKVVRGGVWIFGLRIISRGLGFVRTIILARLLSPNDFGLLGIALLSIAALETFSQTGFQAALIQKKENVESYLDTAWTVSAIRGVILFLVIFLFAPVVAKFFNSPQATLVIKVIAVSILLSGFRNIGILFFQKEMEFNKQFIYELSATVVDLAVSVALAFLLRNVWALVWGGLAGNCIGLFMSYILVSYRPHIRFVKGKVKELFGFGRWVLGSSVLVFLVTQGDDVFVGKMLGVAALGFYQMAYLISNMPTTEIAHLVSQVTFPAYSKLQNDTHRLRRAYLDVLQLTAFISIPMAGGIFILAPEFTQIFLGTKWMPIVPAMQVLAFAGLTRSIASTAGPLFLATGRPQTDTVFQVIRLLVLSIFIYPFTLRWNLTGTSIAVLLSILVATFGFGFQVVRFIECKVQAFAKIVGLPVINGFVMVLIILFAKNWFQHIGVIQFFMIVVLGIISYAVIAGLFDRFFNYGITRLIKEKIGN